MLPCMTSLELESWARCESFKPDEPLARIERFVRGHRQSFPYGCSRT